MTRRRGLLWALVALAGLGLVTAWFGGKGKPSAPAPTLAEVPIEFVAADLETLQVGPLARTVPLTGTLKPVEQTVVKAKVAGELRELNVREGMPVARGQVLGRIDPTEYTVRVREREAALEAARSQMDQTKRSLENTTQLKERAFVSQSALDQARSAWEVAASNREAAEAQLALARKQVADTALIAPIAGIVAERFAQGGEKLPVDGRVLSVVNLSQMEIEAPVPAAEIGAVRVGTAVSLLIEGVNAPQRGRIERIAPGTQAGTRSVPVYIRLDNPEALLRAGLFAHGSLPVEQRSDVLSVPQTALQDRSGRVFVYLIENGRLVERDVILGLRDDTHAVPRLEVLRGLAAGDQIVAARLGALRVGAPVRISAVKPDPVRASEPSPR